MASSLKPCFFIKRFRCSRRRASRRDGTAAFPGTACQTHGIPASLPWKRLQARSICVFSFLAMFPSLPFWFEPEKRLGCCQIYRFFKSK